MTDQGPMQPDYRRRMEAAEAEVERLKKRPKWRDMEAMELRAEAAEQRAIDMERQANALNHDLSEVAQSLAAAEAREQALRDELTTLRGDLTELVQVIETEEYTSPEAEGAAKYRGKQLDRILNPLSPPTADTEESDRG